MCSNTHGKEQNGTLSQFGQQHGNCIPSQTDVLKKPEAACQEAIGRIASSSLALW